MRQMEKSNLKWSDSVHQFGPVFHQNAKIKITPSYPVQFDQFLGLKRSALVASIGSISNNIPDCTFCYKLPCRLCTKLHNCNAKGSMLVCLQSHTQNMDNYLRKHQTHDIPNQGNHTFFPLLSLYMVFLSGRNIAAYKESLLCLS